MNSHTVLNAHDSAWCQKPLCGEKGDEPSGAHACVYELLFIASTTSVQEYLSPPLTLVLGSVQEDAGWQVRRAAAWGQVP